MGCDQVGVLALRGHDRYPRSTAISLVATGRVHARRQPARPAAHAPPHTGSANWRRSKADSRVWSELQSVPPNIARAFNAVRRQHGDGGADKLTMFPLVPSSWPTAGPAKAYSGGSRLPSGFTAPPSSNRIVPVPSTVHPCCGQATTPPLRDVADKPPGDDIRQFLSINRSHCVAALRPDETECRRGRRTQSGSDRRGDDRAAVPAAGAGAFRPVRAAPRQRRRILTPGAERSGSRWVSNAVRRWTGTVPFTAPPSPQRQPSPALSVGREGPSARAEAICPPGRPDRAVAPTTLPGLRFAALRAPPRSTSDPTP